MINLTIPGEPTAKARPRVTKYGTFNETKTINYETLAKELFIISKQRKLEGPLQVTINAEYGIPKSTSKKRKKLMENRELFPMKKPDLDNVAKICLDALNKLAYDDDSQVIRLKVSKIYSNEPKVIITIIKYVSEQNEI